MKEKGEAMGGVKTLLMILKCISSSGVLTLSYPVSKCALPKSPTVPQRDPSSLRTSLVLFLWFVNKDNLAVS